MKSGNLTVTDARLLRALQTAGETASNTTRGTGNSSTTSTAKAIDEAIDKVSVRTGVVKKYYMNINRVEVKLTGATDTVNCILLRPFGDEFPLKYSPLGDYDWDSQKGEGYLIPRAETYCIVAPLGADDKFDYVFLGFFNPSNTPECVPAPGTGNVKLSCIGATDEYFINFGIDGFNIVASQTNKYVGSVGEYANVNDDYYEKSEVYTKEEVDKLIEELREELDPNNTIDNDEGGTT